MSAEGSHAGDAFITRRLLNSNPAIPPTLAFLELSNKVPTYKIRESELEASKEGHTLTDFNRDSSTNQSGKHAELPFCFGIQGIVFSLLLLSPPIAYFKIVRFLRLWS
ncbi:hypothetical protein DITRI_Ditri07aG0089700 [Diplodiscus trichospermus]